MITLTMMMLMKINCASLFLYYHWLQACDDNIDDDDVDEDELCITLFVLPLASGL
jgi:hypothetical protein